MNDQVVYETYKGEHQLQEMLPLIEEDLSEPYSIYTYRYFLHEDQWPHLCFLARSKEKLVGAIICKLDQHRNYQRGYIGMLAVQKSFRKRGIGSTLVQMALQKMKEEGAHEVVLETEISNTGALGLYQNLGFLRVKRLLRYYLNGVDAFRLKLFLCENK